MKKTILAATIAMGVAGQTVLATEPVTNEQKERATIQPRAEDIRDALITLAKARLLIRGENRSIIINGDVVDQLRKEGVITETQAKAGGVCVGAGN